MARKAKKRSDKKRQWRLPRLGFGSLWFWLVVVIIATLAGTLYFTAAEQKTLLYPPANGQDHVDVTVVDRGFQTSIVIPTDRLREFAFQGNRQNLINAVSNLQAYRNVDISWGDPVFLANLPEVAERLTLATRALSFPNSTPAIRMAGFDGEFAKVFKSTNRATMHLSLAGFAQLVEFIEASFAAEQGKDQLAKPEEPKGATYLYNGRWHFSLAYTGGSWVAEGLRRAGVPSSPIPALFPDFMLMELRKRADAN